MEYEPLEIKYQKAKRFLEEQDREQKKSRMEMERLKEKIKDSLKMIKQGQNEMYEERMNILSAENKRMKRISEKDEIVSELEKIEREIKNFEIPKISETLEVKMNEKSRERIEVKKRLQRIVSEMDDISSEGQQLNHRINNYSNSLREINGVERRKLKALGPNIERAYEWIKNNQNRFNKRVFGPLAVEIKIKDSKYVDQVESSLPRNTMCMFFTFTNEDYDMLNDELNDKMQLRVPIINSSRAKEIENYKPIISNEEMERLGFEKTFLDLIEANREVLRACCDRFSWHLIPVSLKNVKNEEIEKNRKIVKYISNNALYEIKRFKYDSSKFINSIKSIQKAKLFTNFVDDKEIYDLEKKIKEAEERKKLNENRLKEILKEKEKLEIFLSEIQNSLESFQQEKLEINNLKKKFQDLQFKRNNKSRDLNNLLNEIKNLGNLQIMNKKLSKLLIERKKQISIYFSLIKDYKSKNINFIQNGLNLLHENFSSFEIEQEFLQVKNRLENSKQILENIQKDSSQAKKLALEKYNKAIELTGELNDETTECFKNFSNDANEIKGQIDALRQRTLLRDQINGSDVIQRYQRSLEIINEKSIYLSERENSLSEINKSIQEKKSAWFQKITSLVSNISNRFQLFFQELGFKGKIELSSPQDDYDKWSIDILVKFRDVEDYQILSAERQSGGEKSVSTITYLMSLQGLSHSPFRIVDEINQGMDPTNERNVHKMIVKTCTLQTNSQYFLITPKLLNNLYYNEKVTVLCVFNGPEACLQQRETSLAYYL
ncbi:Structural maintenance of chromosomes protein 5 domain-containing protein [Rozella allomycis CSF55]|uniref:Structural maintenance of chromosomes protein 5 n=1 Tax=Rozella allomycis (strain CSF55) TaxID=988480 RepID=A0A075AMK9_ROZAC|nr:Structural maintenance of chromosomes protein 5 domain-containing protein [Rozella allomycis CSF55]|eukprot:EPZ30853.1 Structural maintenance of chromosomes protein 5 domain-containing protein [Rozella allomycis CSF55]